ncbi:cell division trigger factor [Bacillus sp. JCM 19046]|uniref:Trigger factor n=1 Tax=Shouchella xiaoxiensis TaxID=766895 RepID=A0ABS2SVQ5_9BACI|nr:trigger factor [Shouchella xiaoxiensis]MBM7838554.1 trigger factor [Shouchella xiaoxiensis]GAF13390.1 cell division trigger factor [Bacillus sp. JCM 19045]GAF16044.1 cell division trigger factor [Bacillus sp. JCM 19046]
MSAKWEKTEENTGVLTIEVEADKVNDALDKAFKKVVQKVNVPGFRKGKMPRGLFEKQFGVESLYQDAIDILLPDAYAQAVEESGIFPVDRPEIDVETIGKNEVLIFKATVTVKPEVKLGDYKGLEVEVPSTEVTDEDVEEEVKKLQERHAELVVVEEGEIQDGDTAVIDFAGYANGEAFEGGTAENYSLEIGSNSFIPGFEEQLVGLKSGEEKDVEITFPEEYHAEDLAGQPATFKVKIHDIKRKELPELDDEFAKDANDQVESMDELKAELRKTLEEQSKMDSENAVRDALLEKAADQAEINVPDAMVTTETDRMLQEFGQRLQSQGMNLEMYFQFSGQTEDDMREQFKEDASKRVRVNLTLEAISEKEDVQVSDEEIDEEVQKMADMYQRSADEIKALLSAQGGLENVRGDLKMRKAIDVLVENSKEAVAE